MTRSGYALTELARELTLPLIQAGDTGFDLLLVLTPEHLELRDNSAGTRSGAGMRR